MPLIATLPPSRLCAADTAYGSNALRTFLIARGTEPAIPDNPTRKHIQPFDAEPYKRRNIIERTFSGLEEGRASHYRGILGLIWLAAIGPL